MLQNGSQTPLCWDALLSLQNEWLVVFFIVACSSLGLMVNKQINSFAIRPLWIHGDCWRKVESELLSSMEPLCVHLLFLSFNFQIYCQCGFTSWYFFSQLLEKNPEWYFNSCATGVWQWRDPRTAWGAHSRDIDYGSGCILADGERVNVLLDSATFVHD